MGKDSASRAKRDIAAFEWKNAYAQWEKDYKLSKEEYKVEHKIINKYDSIARTRETFYYDFERGDSILRIHSMTYFNQRHRETRTDELRTDNSINFSEITSFTDDSHGHLLSQIVYRNGEKYSSDEWTYDKNVRCTLHINGDNHKTWAYDSKGMSLNIQKVGVVN